MSSIPPEQKLLSRSEFVRERCRLQACGIQVVFTNGCFDLIHRAHIEYLQEARRLGDTLFVGLNGDRAVSALKGPGRPLNRVDDRAAILAALQCVDRICVFDEPSVEGLVVELQPDVLVKGGDYRIHEVVGRASVEASGGRVCVVRKWPGQSTTQLIRRIRQLIP